MLFARVTHIAAAILAAVALVEAADSTSKCSWPGHCLGAKCKTDDDCADDLTCVKKVCGGPAVSATPAQTPAATTTVVVAATTRPANVVGSTSEATPASLASCLAQIKDGTTVILPSSSSYASALLGKDLRFTFKPAAIFVPVTESHVQKGVQCAKASKTAVAPRSGGHSYEGYSQGGADGALVIDMYKINSVVVDKTAKTASIGPGVALAPLYYQLFQAGFAFPGGTCPTVGAGGLTLGGGFGLLSRKYGLSLDQVLEMRLVDANGDVRVANANTNADLFFALRGAGGGSYGVVTNFKVKLQTAPKVTTSFTYDWPAASYQKVLAAYNAWGPTATPDLTTELNWDSSGSLELQGIFLGKKSDLTAALKGFMDVAGQAEDSDVREETLIDSILRFTYMDSTDPKSLLNPKAQDAHYMKGNSIMYTKPLSAGTLNVMKKYLSKSAKPKGSTGAYAIVDLWGGKVNEVASSASAFVHRDKLFGIELVVEWGDADAPPGKPDCTACLTWIKDFMNALSAQYLAETPGADHISAYQNYIDSNLPNWQKAYYEDAFSKLVTTKTKYDPTNLFRFPQSIPVQANAALKRRKRQASREL